MFFDIGIGLVLTAIIGWATGATPSVLLITVGMIGSLWPDVDAIIWKLRGKKMDHLAHQHRDLLHYPLIFTPLLSMAVGWILGWQAGTLFAVATLAHFTHDTIGHAWGIRWFYPLDSRYWCYRSYGSQPTRLYAWTKTTQDILCGLYGNRTWMQQTYGQWNAPLMIEMSVLMAGLVSVTIWYSSTLF